LDAGIDASILDAGSPDVNVIDAAVDASSDAAMDAAADATTDGATADASDGAAIKDAKSDVCNPNIEPCTTRADTGPDTDAGDAEDSGNTGGCSCDTASSRVLGAASVSPFLLLLAAAALSRRKRS
jgi:hypothetical protein